jgi:two-component system, OmpR family, phosphate regulon sensor histidine kinase PhoR
MIVAVLVLSGGSFRASFQLDKLREQAVVEASLELANARASLLEQMIIDQDNIVMSEVDTYPLGKVAESWLNVAERQTPTVRAVMIVELNTPLREVVVYASRAPGGSDDEFRHLVLYRVLSDLELSDKPEDQLRHLHQTYFGQNYLFSYWQRSVGGERYLVLAWHDVPRIVHDHLPSLYAEQGAQNRLNIVDSKGRIIFGPPLSDGEYTVGRQFQTTLYKWRLNVSLSAAEQLAASTERRLLLEIVLVTLSALVVIAGMVLILTAAARERRLANLKSEFVANVSHELKTPLSLIRMFAELLQGGMVGNPEKRRQYVDIIVSESERLGALIENVLNFSKVERGLGAYEFAERDIHEVVRKTLSSSMHRAERAKVEIVTDIPDAPLRVRMDERAIDIAVNNLVDNALKYASTGGYVGVSVANEGPLVEIVVVDRGPGIAPDERSRIFDRFVRGEPQPGDTRPRGSGIGLSLVKSVAEAHGGRAWVDDAPGGGSAFHLTMKKSK